MYHPNCHIIVKGAGCSDLSKTTAFDAALVNAGIGHLNLVPVTSVVSPHSKELDAMPSVPTGTVVHCVLARADIVQGQRTTVCLGYAFSPSHGSVVEARGSGADEAIERCANLLEEMIKIRGDSKGVSKIVSQELECPNHSFGCAIVALLLLRLDLNSQEIRQG